MLQLWRVVWEQEDGSLLASRWIRRLLNLAGTVTPGGGGGW